MTTAPEAIIGNTMLGQLLRTIGGGIRNTSGAIRDKLSGILSTEQGQEADSNIQSAYQKYLDSINKEIVATRNQKPNIAEVSGEYTPSDDFNIFDIYFENAQIPRDSEVDTAVDPSVDPEIDDKDLQEEIERSLLNQYSLLGEEDLAGSLVDETQESELEGIIDPKIGEDDNMDPASVVTGVKAPVKDNNMPYGYPGLNTVPNQMSNYFNPDGSFREDTEIDDVISATPFSTNISTMPKLGDEIKSVDFSNLGYKDGGSVYNVLKLINDTMHDG